MAAEKDPTPAPRVARRRENRRADVPGGRDEEATVADQAQTYNGYCVKCKEKRDFEGHVEVSKTGMNMAKGKCPVCGTTVNRILGKAKV
ncbi:hypothetical protein AWV63_14420 [Micromonospora rifamycinica]|uniref:Uncharacterized protein n=1 Tax=Micromonospora rifamycinica TaxID=291594 RepID=A0A109IK36_9ACTN|nr:hypothetical protein AWV63_14420 [Micromonospora rifamycinica]SCG79646.1 hypothetical protein GA0070623_4707 [Micromonospora rifamycinica]